MAKLITKFKYLKPSDKRSPGGYAKYIATREGVEKIDDSQRFAPETKRQRQFIQKIISDFPESTSILEYEDYLNKPTRENASEFIQTSDRHLHEQDAAALDILEEDLDHAVGKSD